jgi:hypothetical protein
MLQNKPKIRRKVNIDKRADTNGRAVQERKVLRQNQDWTT